MNKLDLDVKFWNHVEKTGTCWLWTGAKTTNKYSCVYRNNKTQTGSRYVWINTFGAIPNGLFVLHRCDVRHCVNPDHLFLGTHQENMKDRNSKSRQAIGNRNGRKTKPEHTARGEKSAKAKLNSVQVLEIRELYVNGESRAELARKYSISWNAVNAIIERKVWRHV